MPAEGRDFPARARVGGRKTREKPVKTLKYRGFSCIFRAPGSITFGRNLGCRPQRGVAAAWFAPSQGPQHRRAERPMAKKAAPKAAASKAAPTPTPAPAPAPAPAAAPAVKPEKVATPRPKAATKAELFSKISEKTGLSKKDVDGVFDALGELVRASLSKKPGLFVIPGLLKLKVVRKPATKAKQGINPFTKEPMTFKAKPARNVIKAIPLKSLKESV